MEKTNDNKMLEVFKHSAQLEKAYNEMSKEDLVNMMVFKDMMNEAFDAESTGMNLWCYVSDQTGLRYLTDEMPRKYFTIDDEDGIFITEGQVNIRVPKAMESMFPELNYGDEPVKISLSVTY